MNKLPAPETAELAYYLNAECSLKHFRAMQSPKYYINLSKTSIIQKLTSCAREMHGRSVTFALNRGTFFAGGFVSVVVSRLMNALIDLTFSYHNE